MSEYLGETRSICPICGQQLPARRVRENGQVFLGKTCPEHGDFSSVIWRGPIDFLRWRGRLPQLKEHENQGCPHSCGLCGEHQQGSCCIVLEVTKRCNLACRFCFAEGELKPEHTTLQQIKQDIDSLVKPGQTFLQLSGGEPTLRHDLPEIVAYAKAAGCQYVQLNTNGLRLAEDEAYVQALAEAGLSIVFLQFDGTDDAIYRQLRGQDLLTQKIQAIEHCSKHNIGVTLVPTLVPGINTADIGNMLRLAIALAPAVRGLHFQPVAFLGRYPQPPSDEDRYTLGDLLGDLLQQSNGLIQQQHIAPSRCDHPLCGFHAGFIVQEDGSLQALSSGVQQDCCCSTARQNREYIGRRWQRQDMPQPQTDDGLEQFLWRSKTYAFTVTAMAFQDVYNLDIERLRRCSLHVYKDGQFIPFCSYYLRTDVK